jgi:hypothetical protein
MAESLDRKPEDNTSEAIQKRMAKYRKIDVTERTTAADVPRWVKMAMAKVEVLGLSYKDAAKEFNKSSRTLDTYARAPYIIEWRKQLREWAEDPIRVANAIIRGSVIEAALDQVWAIETAKAGGDYKEVRLGTKDILATHNVLKPANTTGRGESKLMVSINLGGTLDALEAPAGVTEVSYEEVVSEVPDFEIMDDLKTEWDEHPTPPPAFTPVEGT